MAALRESPALGRLRQARRDRKAVAQTQLARAQNDPFGLRRVQLQRKPRPAAKHERIAPRVLERPARRVGVGLRSGLDHARQQRVDEDMKVAPHTLAWKQCRDTSDARCPARLRELVRNNSLQGLHRVEQTQPIRRQDEQRQRGGLVVPELGDERAQDGDACPLRSRERCGLGSGER